MLLPWSPLAKGRLTGKYTRADLEQTNATETRRSIAAGSGVLSDRGLTITEVVPRGRGRDRPRRGPGRSRLDVTQPSVTAPIIGARTLSQLENNLGALEAIFTNEERASRLQEASAIDLGFPHELLNRPRTRGHILDGTRLENHT